MTNDTYMIERLPTDYSNEWCLLPENPFTGEIIIHPNHAGLPAIVAQWRFSDFIRPGLILMFGSIRLGLETWGGAHELTFEVEQSGRITSSACRVGQTEDNKYGLAFEHDGSPFVIRFALRLLDQEHFPGSVVALAPISYIHPVSEAVPTLYCLGDSPAAPDDVRSLIAANQGGMMNRIIPMLSTFRTAELCGRAPYVWWGENEHCAARFEDLFDLSASGISMTNANFVAKSYSIYDAYSNDPAPLDLMSPERNIVVHSLDLLKTSPPNTHTPDDLVEYFGRLSLSDAVKQRLQPFDKVDFSRTVGLHIRRPYPGNAFADLENSKFQLGMDVFVELIEAIRRDLPEYDRILVCTNSFEAEAEVKKRFGSYIVTFKKETIDNTKDRLAVQEALVDLILLSRCAIVISQETTSFGRFAHILGRCPLICLTGSTSAETYEFWRFDKGVHVETFLAPRGDVRSFRIRIPSPTGR